LLLPPPPPPPLRPPLLQLLLLLPPLLPPRGCCRRHCARPLISPLDLSPVPHRFLLPHGCHGGPRCCCPGAGAGAPARRGPGWVVAGDGWQGTSDG
jgi:hypothetical protein